MKLTTGRERFCPPSHFPSQHVSSGRPIHFLNKFCRPIGLASFVFLCFVLFSPNTLQAQTDTGLRSPTANAAETTSAGDNNGYQTSPGNASALDGLFAVDTDSGSNTGTSCTGTDKDKHRFYNYGLSIPTGATINGIEVRLDARADSTSGTPRICVQLSWDGGTTWTTAKTSANLTTTLASYTLGNATDNWGRTWAESNFTDASFRVRLINIASSTSRDFTLDWVAVRVHYALPTVPTIAALAPSSGSSGTSVTISGYVFGATQGSSTVTFNGIPATPTAWSDTSITVAVPSGATSGPVVVTAGGIASNGVTFTVKPQINNLSPTSGQIGTSVTINGASFGATQGSSTVTFNGTAATPSSWSAGSIVVPVPAAASTGSVIVTVGGQASNGVTFAVVPTINTLSPTAALPGTSVTISGSGFGATQGTSTVQFNGVTATPSSWNNTSIVAPVPSSATTGSVIVTVGGQASNGVSFTVIPPPPQISSLSPNLGPAGTTVTIIGTSFGATQGSSSVTFNGMAAAPSSWSATSIVVQVPPGATTGNVTVTVGGEASNGAAFTVGDVYRLHSEVSTSAGLMQLKQAPPDAAATSVSVAMTSKSGDQLIKAFNTFDSNWHSNGTIPAGSTLSFTIWMRKDVTAGTMTPRAKLYLNNETGTLLCSGTTTTALAVSTTTPTKYVLTCTTTADVSIASTDQLYLWVGVNISTSTTSAVNAVIHFEGVPNGNYDSYVIVPLPPGPKITSVSPASGPIGSSITINGTLFGATKGSSTATIFGYHPLTVTAWSDTSITATIPPPPTNTTFSTVQIVVTVAGNGSNGVSFTVTPTITQLSPTSGIVGTSMIIDGTSFGGTQGSSTVTLNGVSAPIGYWSDTSIIANVSTSGTSGPVVLTVNGVAVTAGNFTVIPTINASITTKSAQVGGAVRVYGSGFGPTQGTSTVTFNGVPATPTNWTAGFIDTTVPAGAATGPLVVTVGGQVVSTSFTVLPTPHIDSVSPAFGPPGTTVTITGTDFGATQGSSTVTFGNLIATPSSWSNTSIVTQIPWANPDSFFPTIFVTVAGVQSNVVSFTVGDIYHLHSEASSTSGLMQLKKEGPDATATSVSVAMNGKSGDQLIKAFDTQLNDPNIAGTISDGATLSFTLWMRKDTANGTMTPRAKLYLNSASGPLLCTATTTTTLAVSTTTPTKYVLSCTTTTTVTIAKTDRLYLWVGVNISTSTTSAVNAVVHLEGSLNGNYDSYIVAPIPYQPEITSLSPTSGPVTTSVTISGKRFRATQGTSTVSFNGVTATPTSWSDTSITVPVPTAATTGPVTVNVSGLVSNGVTFTVVLGTPMNIMSIPGEGYIYIKWAIPLGGDIFTTYNLYRRTGTGSYALLSGGISDTAYKDTTAQAGVIYKYVVAAINPSGQETARSIETREVQIPPTVLKSYNSANVFAAAKGDLNGDELLDFTFVRSISDATGIYTQVEIFLGGSTQSTPNYTLTPSAPGWFNTVVMVDLNHDGYDELIVGDPGYNNFAGQISVFAGGSQFSTTPVFRLIGDPDPKSCFNQSDGGQLGFSIAAAGDINGDGYLDVVAGAPYSGNCLYGEVVFIKGGPNLSNLDTDAWVGPTQWGYAGYSVAGVGDVNGDGYADVLVGAPSISGNSGFTVGHAYLLTGGNPGVALSATFDQGGPVASLGDINGDGFPDFAIASSFGQYVYFGGTAIDTTPDLTLSGINVIFPAGRLNEDAFDDIVSSQGLVSYFGSTSKENYADIKSGGGYADGRNVLGVVDFNGDGINEVITTDSASPPTTVRIESLAPYLSLPEIRIASPLNYTTTFNQSVALQGSVSGSVSNLTVGGQAVTVAADGTFQTDLSLATGDNVIEIIADASSSRVVKRTLTITFVQPPPLTISITSPANGATVNEVPFLVNGTISDPLLTNVSVSTSVFVNGVKANVVNNTSFTAYVDSPEGANTVTATVSRSFGNPPPAVQAGTPASVNVTVISKGTVTGTVTDSATGLPLAGATVVIWNAYVNMPAVADANGVYSVQVPGSRNGTVPQGYQVDIYKPGYYSVPCGCDHQTLSVSVTPGQTTTLNGTMTPNIFVTIDSPQNGAVFTSTPVLVTGRVSSGIAQSPQNGVVLNGTLYPVNNGSYAVQLPLGGGPNTITAGVWDGHIATASASVNVTLDLGNAPATITGILVDQLSDLPIPSVSVSVQNSANPAPVLTDANGRYTISNLAPGSYTIVFQKTGYYTLILDGSLVGGQILTLNREISPVMKIENVVVTPGSDTATIEWTTSYLADCSLVYGPTVQYGGFVNPPEIVANHQVPLTGLLSGTVYHFKITCLSGGHPESSPDMTFTTQGPPTIGIVTGTVTSASTALPISSAIISITDAANSTQTAVTDVNGQYTIAVYTPGNFTGTITKVGYVDYVLSGSVSAGQTITQNAASVPDYPVISNIAITDIGDHTATIRWTTNQAADSRVDYGFTSTYSSTAANSTLVTDHGLVLTGLSAGTTYHFKITSTNGYGASASSTDAIFATASPITLTILSPLEGEVIGRSEVLVKGTVTDSTGQEVGVRINGVLGNIYNGQFVANHVPLTDGVNTLTVTATDILGNTATASVNVQSIPASDYITFSANIETGIAPLQTTLKIDSTFPFTASTLSTSGPGSAQITAVSASEYQATFTVEGIYFITARVTDGQGVLHTDTVAITVLNATQMDTLLKGKWDGMKAALAAGNMSGAMAFITPGAQSRYRPGFEALGPDLSTIIESLPNIELLDMGQDSAEYVIVRPQNGQNRLYIIEFSRDANGLWKIQAF